MKKNKMYFFLAILSTIFLLSFAATCNQCSAAAAEEEKVGVEEEETAEEEVAAEEEAAEEEEEVAEEEEEAEEEKEAPTIALEIYEGPTPFEGICYYRVKATVTGNPSPDVDWSKDDSGGAWGTKKAQVNLNDPGDTYTLTATATNSEDTDIASIDLSWGCGPLAVEKTLVLHPSYFGTVGPSGFVTPAVLTIGDSEFNTDWRGRFAFDVSALAGKDIQSAKLKLAAAERSYPLCDFRGEIVIFYNDFLPDLTASDYGSAGYAGPQSFAWDANPLEFSTDFLRDKVKERADSGVMIQFGIGYAIPISDFDGIIDGIAYLSDGVTLTVIYLE